MPNGFDDPAMRIGPPKQLNYQDFNSGCDSIPGYFANNPSNNLIFGDAETANSCQPVIALPTGWPS